MLAPLKSIFLGAAIACAALAACSSSGSSHAAPPGSGVDGGLGAGEAGATPVAIALAGCGVNYTASVTVGDQPFTLIVDTGSAIMGVGGASCESCVDGGVSPLYVVDSSATDTHTPASESFANGTGWSGDIVEDSVSVGSAPAAHVSLVDIDSQKGFFSALDAFCGASISGIFGLGPSALLQKGTTSYLDDIAQKGSPDLFSFQLCPSSGNLWLGGFDAAYAPDWVPMVPSEKFYSATVSSIDVAGKSIGLPAASFGDAFVDTGGDALWLPTDAFNAVIGAIGSDSHFTGVFGDATKFFTPNYTSCAAPTETAADLDAMLPPLTLHFANGVSVQARATSGYLLHFEGCGWAPALFTRGAAGEGLPPIELGAPILHDKVVVIDRAQQRIGFAPAPCP